jgi:hypothetical protein
MESIVYPSLKPLFGGLENPPSVEREENSAIHVSVEIRPVSGYCGL